MGLVFCYLFRYELFHSLFSEFKPVWSNHKCNRNFTCNIIFLPVMKDNLDSFFNVGNIWTMDCGEMRVLNCTYGTTAASAIDGWLTRRASSSAGGTWMKNRYVIIQRYFNGNVAYKCIIQKEFAIKITLF